MHVVSEKALWLRPLLGRKVGISYISSCPVAPRLRARVRNLWPPLAHFQGASSVTPLFERNGLLAPPVESEIGADRGRVSRHFEACSRVREVRWGRGTRWCSPDSKSKSSGARCMRNKGGSTKPDVIHTHVVDYESCGRSWTHPDRRATHRQPQD